MDRGIMPRVRFNIQNTFTNGPVEAANVVGEIRGTEHPEQILVVGRASGFLGFGGRHHGQWIRYGGRARGGGRDQAFGSTAPADDSIRFVYRRRAGTGRIDRVRETAPIGNGESPGRFGVGCGAGSR